MLICMDCNDCRDKFGIDCNEYNDYMNLRFEMAILIGTGGGGQG